MKKEEFLKEVAHLNRLFKDAQANLESLKEEYLEENREFKDGDKVMVTYKRFVNLDAASVVHTDVAYIHYAVVLKSGDIDYSFYFANKNGTKSTRKWQMVNYEKIEPFTPQS